MRKNSMTKCAVGAMLFGGTLGTAATAQAGLTFTNAGAAPTTNYAYNYGTGAVFNNATASFSAASVSLGGVNASWSATTDSAGFSVTTAPTTQALYYVNTTRTFTVTGTQEVALSWSGSGQIFFYQTGPTAAIPGLVGQPNWSVSSSKSLNFTRSGSVTVTLGAGSYRIESSLNNEAGSASNFNFAVVPAPGALALLGVAGIVGARRRRA